RSASTGRFDQEDAAPSPTHPLAPKPLRLAGGGSGGGAVAVGGASGGLSPPTGRSAVEGSPTGRGGSGGSSSAAAAVAAGPWTGPSAEALFVRLLAEVLRWLEAPAVEESGNDGSAGRKAVGLPLGPIVTGAGGGGGGGGGWYSWLASQKVRFTSQMAQLEGAAMAAMAGGGSSGGSSGKRTQQQHEQRGRMATQKANGADVEEPWRNSDPGSGFLLTQQLVVHPRNA
ncbi:hypothetical protein Vretimale_9208, partial [Volvox reticuliferus]